MQPMIRFRDLPGISVIEQEAMIANKFHHLPPKATFDAMSHALFGITADEAQYLPPQWFLDGFESAEDWENAGSRPPGPYYGTDNFDQYEEGSPREGVFQEMDDFEWRLCGGRELIDDYDRMAFAKGLGLDFSDQTGQHPLHLTPYFFRQAIAAARGLKGHMPDLSELRDREWGSKLEEEARRFKKTKKAS